MQNSVIFHTLFFFNIITYNLSLITNNLSLLITYN